MPFSSAIKVSPPDRWVICLCAEWCDLCCSYRALFTSMAARYPSSRFVWLDIEDQSSLVGDIEVETFPTLLISHQQGTQFMGPLTPHAHTLSRLLDSLESSTEGALAHSPATARLLQSLEATPEYWVNV